MAKVKLKGLGGIEKNIEKTFGKVRTSRAMRDDIGQFLVERVKAEARRAKPLNDTRSFPNLKESTKEIRKALAKTNQTHPTYKANRSNLTLTGQLIDAIIYKLKSGAVISLEIDNNLRRPYVRKNKKPEPAKTNKQIDKELRERGFELYTAKGIDSEPRILKRINGIVRKYVRRAIKVNFGT